MKGEAAQIYWLDAFLRHSSSGFAGGLAFDRERGRLSFGGFFQRLLWNDKGAKSEVAAHLNAYL